MNKAQLLRIIKTSKDKNEIAFAKNELLLRYWKII